MKKRMKCKEVIVINRTNFMTKDIKEIAGALLKGQSAPNFYLLCELPNQFNGISISNLDKPIIIIFIENLEQFARVFVHELIHIQQHSKNYTDEYEAIESERDIIISDNNNPKGIKLI